MPGKHIAPDMKAIDVEMRLRWWNANYVGTHFGGSLFAMTDAFYAHADGQPGTGLHCVGQNASIRYRQPGKGTLRAEFRPCDRQIDDIREKLETLPRYEPVFTVEGKDEAGVVIAEVEEVLDARRKEAAALPEK